MHKEQELYLLFESGELTPGEAEEFRRHLAQCSDCQERVSLARAAHRASGALLEEPAEALVQASLDRVQAFSIPRRAIGTFGVGVVAGLAVLAIVVYLVNAPRVPLEIPRPLSVLAEGSGLPWEPQAIFLASFKPDNPDARASKIELVDFSPLKFEPIDFEPLAFEPAARTL